MTTFDAFEDAVYTRDEYLQDFGPDPYDPGEWSWVEWAEQWADVKREEDLERGWMNP